MELSYKQLEKALLSHFRIAPDKEQTFRSRIKQLQRLNFPVGVNVGRGTKMVYGADHLFMLVSAFELISSGLPAQMACNLINTHWDQLAAGYALAALQFRQRDYHSEVIAVFNVKTLHEIQFSKTGPVKSSRLTIYDQAALPIIFDRANTLREGAFFMLALSTISGRILRSARDQAGVIDAWQRNEIFNAWVPRGRVSGFFFGSGYPDKSNLEMRQQTHQMFKNDPNSLTEEGAAEAREFLDGGFQFRPVRD